MLKKIKILERLYGLINAYVNQEFCNFWKPSKFKKLCYCGYVRSRELVPHNALREETDHALDKRINILTLLCWLGALCQGFIVTVYRTRTQT